MVFFRAQSQNVLTYTPVRAKFLYAGTENLVFLGSGAYEASDMKLTDSLCLLINDPDLKIFFTIESFKIIRVSKTGVEEVINTGAKYTSAAKDLIGRALHGDIYIFDTISYSTTNSKGRLKKSIVIRVL